MSLRIADAELFGVTESSVTLSFVVVDRAGPVECAARVRLGGDVVAESRGPAGTRLVRIDGLAPDTAYPLHIEADGADAFGPDRFCPAEVRTLPAPRGRQVASFATLNDLHFGEPRFGGTLASDGGYGEARPGYPDVRDTDDAVPYWLAMNEDAVSEVNAAGVDAAIVKGDVADAGLPAQFEVAARTFAGFRVPHHVFLGNHDHYGVLHGEHVDGYGILGQPPAPRVLALGGWRLVLVDTVAPGEHHGVFPDDRLAWLRDVLGETRASGAPTLLLAHHQPVPVEHADRFPNTIGLLPEDSGRLCALLAGHPQLRAVLVGHTHRNRVHRHPGAPGVPIVEVACVKDYPGVWAHYRLFDDGTVRQEVCRIATPRALAHSTRCRDFFAGGYRTFALGRLAERSFVAGGMA